MTITVDVTNTGDRAGSDVVQVYVHDRSGVVLRPRRELGGFAKVHLEAGASETVSIELGPRAFAFYDVEREEWAIPSGEFDIEIARSSTDVVHTLDVEVTDGVTTSPEPPETTPVAASDDAFRRRLGRPIPEPRPVRPFSRQSTVEEIGETLLGRLVGDIAWRSVPITEEIERDPGMMRTLRRSVAELPLRGFVLLTGGRVGFEALDTLIELLNGRFRDAASKAWSTAVEKLGRARGVQ